MHILVVASAVLIASSLKTVTLFQNNVHHHLRLAGWKSGTNKTLWKELFKLGQKMGATFRVALLFALCEAPGLSCGVHIAGFSVLPKVSLHTKHGQSTIWAAGAGSVRRFRLLQ